MFNVAFGFKNVIFIEPRKFDTTDIKYFTVQHVYFPPFFRFGRKPTLCASFVCLIAVAVSVAWTPSIEVYMFQSALIGFFVVGMFMPVFVVGTFIKVTFGIITRVNRNSLNAFLGSSKICIYIFSAPDKKGLQITAIKHML